MQQTSSALPVGAGLTVLSFRRDLRELKDEYRKNAEISFANQLEDGGVDAASLTEAEWEHGVFAILERSPQCDLQVLLSRTKDLTWSAPKQDLRNGALFFYLGSRARQNVRRCLRQAETNRLDPDSPFMQSLLAASQYIEENAGSVIGVAKVLGMPGQGEGPGFRGRVSGQGFRSHRQRPFSCLPASSSLLHLSEHLRNLRPDRGGARRGEG